MEFTIDVSKITIAGFRKVSNSRMAEDKGDDILADAAGLNIEQVRALNYNDYRRLLRAFFKAANEPLDPN